jgi:hypothetical protein
MFSIAQKRNKSSALIPKANDVLHDWDREDTLQAIEQLSEAKDVHTLGELFALHRIMQKYKERKGVREEKADNRFLRQSVH